MVNGWDERDYQLWSELQQLPSYGIVNGTLDRLISRKAVVQLLEKLAEARHSSGEAQKEK